MTPGGRDRSPSSTRSFYARFGKRCFDGLCAFSGLLLLAPVLLGLGLAVFVSSGGPVFFRQRRTGLGGRPFWIWKFRTMANLGGGQEALVTAAGDSRITPFGRWLRRTKCDELPQLVNVLKGEMSLVGPRPEVPYYTARYTERQRAVLEMRPGITGPAATEYLAEERLLARAPDKEAFYVSVLLPEKLERDLGYARTLSFRGDLRLILNTLVRLAAGPPEIQKLTPRASRREA